VRVLRCDGQQLSERELRVRVLAAVRRVQRTVEAVQGLLLRVWRRLPVPRRLADVLLHRAIRDLQRLQPRQVQADLLHLDRVLIWADSTF
jgi:hypothetical protein